MINNITLILKKLSQDSVNKLSYMELLHLAESTKINDNIAKYLLDSPKFDWPVLNSLARNPLISESFHKQHTINHSKVNWWILRSLVENASINKEFHLNYTIKHPILSTEVLEELEDRFPNTNWRKLCSTI